MNNKAERDGLRPENHSSLPFMSLRRVDSGLVEHSKGNPPISQNASASSQLTDAIYCSIIIECHSSHEKDSQIKLLLHEEIVRLKNKQAHVSVFSVREKNTSFLSVLIEVLQCEFCSTAVAMPGTKLVILISLAIHPITCTPLPFIVNVSLVSRFPTNFTIIYNSSCDQCLCLAHLHASAAVNCLSNNNTCQLFATVPARYRLQPATQSILYFTNGIIPSPSQCCMPNTTSLIEKLHNATAPSVLLQQARCLVLDDHGFLVTVQEGKSNLSRFNAQDLTLIDTTTFSSFLMNNVAYHQGAYFLATQSNNILVVNSTNLTLISTVNAPGLNELRDMMFLQGGQIMVVASAYNKTLLFFNRSTESPRNYTFVSQVSTSFDVPSRSHIRQ